MKHHKDRKDLITPETRDQLVAAYQEATRHLPAIRRIDSLLENSVAGVLEEGFEISKDTGDIVLRSGVDAIKAYVAGFKALGDLYERGAYLASGFAFHEAKLALSAKLKFGPSWPNFFPSTDMVDVPRVRRNINSLEDYVKCGGTLRDGLTMGAIRMITERAYDKFDPENNRRLKAEVIKQVEKEVYSSKTKLRQKEVMKIVSKAAVIYDKPQNVQQWRYGYFLVDWQTKKVGLVGSQELDSDMAQKAAMVIDWPKRYWLSQDAKSGQWIGNVIGTYAGAPAAKVLKAQAETQDAATQIPPPVIEPEPASTQLADKFFRERYQEVVDAEPEPAFLTEDSTSPVDAREEIDPVAESILKQQAGEAPTTVRSRVFPLKSAPAPAPKPEEKKPVPAAVDPLAGLDFDF